MCELITIAMAVVASVAFFFARKNTAEKKALMVTSLAFWGAAIMWLVDCIVSAINGEVFFDFSREDLILGGIIAGCGWALFVVLLLAGKIKAAKAK